MTTTQSLPLGVDVGSARVRVASARRQPSGAFEVMAMAARDLPEGVGGADGLHETDLLAAIVEDLRNELGSRERRCVLSLPATSAALRLIAFPKMNWSERRSAARFEADRFCSWDDKSVASVVRVRAIDRPKGIYAVGIARRDALDTRVESMKKAGLKAVRIDHDACALRRAYPLADAVVDVGHRQSTLHAFPASGPISVRVSGGGEEITRGIAADLGIDAAVAEKRKRILGTAGAGDAARDVVVTRIGAAIAKVRERTPIRRIALTGNGARLPGLCAAIEAEARAIVESPVSELLRSGAYPDDVVRAAAPDWTLAVSLAAWDFGG